MMKQECDKETADEIIQETRRIKESLARSMDFDLDRILKDARQRQEKSDRIVLSPPAQPRLEESDHGRHDHEFVPEPVALLGRMQKRVDPPKTGKAGILRRPGEGFPAFRRLLDTNDPSPFLHNVNPALRCQEACDTVGRNHNDTDNRKRDAYG